MTIGKKQNYVFGAGKLTLCNLSYRVLDNDKVLL